MDDTNKTCREFVSALASSAPTPGGGGAAALCGAVGAALCGHGGQPDHRKKEVRRRGKRDTAIAEKHKHFI